MIDPNLAGNLSRDGLIRLEPKPLGARVHEKERLNPVANPMEVGSCGRERGGNGFG
jgi:hypothetical protein